MERGSRSTRQIGRILLVEDENVGGQSNYVAGYGGVEGTYSSRGGGKVEPIAIVEGGLGPELFGIAGFGLTFGGFRQGSPGGPGEYGVFAGVKEGALGEHFATGAGFGFPDSWNRAIDKRLFGSRSGGASGGPCPAPGAGPSGGPPP